MQIKKRTAFLSSLCCFSFVAIVLMITLLSLTVRRQVAQNEIVVPYDTYKMKFYSEKEQGTYTTGLIIILI